MPQRVGLHVSAAGGAANAPENAKEYGAECFQFFSRSPQGGKAPVITEDGAALFRERCQQYNLTSYIHAPYYINFASKKKSIYYGSSSVVRDELVRGTQLGVKYVMTHLGSAREWEGQGEAQMLAYAIEGLKKMYETAENLTTQLLLEISAGAGAIVGDRFEELAALLAGIGRDDVHICLDTCHLFASGYDLRTPETLEATLSEFQRIIGLERLKLLHINDSKAGLGEHKDRHEHLGQGQIGTEGFKALLAHPALQGIDLVLETPHDASIHDDIAFLKKHRAQ